MIPQEAHGCSGKWADHPQPFSGGNLSFKRHYNTCARKNSKKHDYSLPYLPTDPPPETRGRSGPLPGNNLGSGLNRLNCAHVPLLYPGSIFYTFGRCRKDTDRCDLCLGLSEHPWLAPTDAVQWIAGAIAQIALK